MVCKLKIWKFLGSIIGEGANDLIWFSRFIIVDMHSTVNPKVKTTKRK
jgi:hypothetical protein